MDSLPCFQVKVENDDVIVRAQRSALQTSKRLKPMAIFSANSQDIFVIIGGGPAGQVCAETLRYNGFNGKIVMITKENHFPYDRVKVSKTWNATIETLQFRINSFYDDADIKVLRNTEAVKIDPNTKYIFLSNNEKMSYSKCFIATGSSALIPCLEGVNLKNIYTIRNFDDSNRANLLLGEDKEIVVLGSSFIAFEAAAYCVGKVKKVTIISRGKYPFQTLLGARIGEAIKQYFESKGAIFIGNSGIEKFIGNHLNELSSLKLINGNVMKADLCILGTGSTLNTHFLKASGISLKSDGSIEVDSYMKTATKDVFAGGDISYAPLYGNKSIKACIGHFGLAHLHGRIAALNMLENKKELNAVPVFWTMLLGKSIRYAGNGHYDEILYSGDVNKLKFVAYYLKNDEIVAISSCGMDPYVAKYAELRTEGKRLTKNCLGKDFLNWTISD